MSQERFCPVCHMDPVPDVGTLVYQGLSFGFCSRQCVERFKANPALYVGQPGNPSPKQRGERRIRRRVLKLGSLLSENQQQKLISSLEGMMGISRVCIDQEVIFVEYDLMETTCEQIETSVEQCGARLGNGWGARLKQAFIHFTEDTELDTLESSQSGHGHHHH